MRFVHDQCEGVGRNDTTAESGRRERGVQAEVEAESVAESMACC